VIGSGVHRLRVGRGPALAHPRGGHVRLARYPRGVRPRDLPGRDERRERRCSRRALSSRPKDWRSSVSPYASAARPPAAAISAALIALPIATSTADAAEPDRRHRQRQGPRSGRGRRLRLPRHCLCRRAGRCSLHRIRRRCTRARGRHRPDARSRSRSSRPHTTSRDLTEPATPSLRDSSPPARRFGAARSFWAGHSASA
jgi:hypothetical protein